jgi:fatty acid amide hydrolase
VKKYILAPLFKLFRQKTLLHYNENSKVDVYQYLVDSGKRKENNIKFI